MTRNIWTIIVVLVIGSIRLYAQNPNVILEPLVSGLTTPVFLTNAHDDTNRIFIVEQAGRIYVMQPDSPSVSLFLDISDGRVLSGGEQGLLGLAFHPQFSSNRRFLVNYTRQPDGATVVAEYHVSSSNPNLADPASEIILLVIAQPFANHNGGMIEFGPDNFLYIGMGDGGSGNDPQNRAQNINDLLGKILRIDVDRPTSLSVLYSSPSTNPFFGATPGRDEIFAIGFRNPWRFSFDRVGGQLYVGDVGQNTIEEIDVVTLGRNYGWRVFEGTLCTGLGPGSCPALASTPPVTEYAHGELGRCSVTGGYVYRGSRSSLPFGAYVFGDFCSGEVFMLHNGTRSLVTDTSFSISSFGEDEAGEIYVVGIGGSIVRIASSIPPPPSQFSYSVPEHGGLSIPASNTEPGLATGYARIQPDSGTTAPHALGMFRWQQNGILVSEASVPGGPAIQAGRFLASIAGSTNTAVAVANPNPQPVTFTFYYTDADGVDSGQRSFVISAGGQTVAFLNQNPFFGEESFDGTLTFNASAPVSVMAISALINERSEFLFTTQPVVPLTVSTTTPATFSQWVQGGGWTSNFALVNPTDSAISGEIRLLTMDGQSLDVLQYSIPPKSSRRFSPADPVQSIQVGSARIVPSVGSTPSGFALFQLRTADGVVTMAGVPAIPASLVFLSYGEASTAVNTALAFANPSSSLPAVINIDLMNLEGTGAVQGGIINLPASGQRALFLNEIPGLTSMTMPFQGIVRVTSSAPVAVTAFKCRTNQRGDFLIAANPPFDESSLLSSSRIFFPHLAVGGGYEMHFLLLNSQPNGAQSGGIDFFAPDGSVLPLMIPQN